METKPQLEVPSKEPAPPLSKPRSEKLNSLELLRAVSALAVVVFHYQHFYFRGHQPVGFQLPQQPFFFALKPLYLYGDRGVEVFWCISGFIFFWKYADQIKNREISASRFAWLRFTRLYPLHLLTLLAVAIFASVYKASTGTFFVYEWNDARHFFLNLFFASQWGFQKGFSFNGPVWSISLEVLAYALFFVTTYLMAVSVKRTIIYALVAFCFVIPSDSRMVLQSAVFCFYLGGLMSLVADRVTRSRKPIWIFTTIVIIAGGAISAFLWRLAAFNRVSVIAASASLILVLTMNDRLFDGPRLSRLAKVGNLTYASYMIHFPLQLAIVTIAGLEVTRRAAAFTSFFLFYVGATFSLAYLVYYQFERPVQQALRRWSFPASGTIGPQFSGEELVSPSKIEMRSVAD